MIDAVTASDCEKRMNPVLEIQKGGHLCHFQVCQSSLNVGRSQGVDTPMNTVNWAANSRRDSVGIVALYDARGIH